MQRPYTYIFTIFTDYSCLFLTNLYYLIKKIFLKIGNKNFINIQISLAQTKKLREFKKEKI